MIRRYRFRADRAYARPFNATKATRGPLNESDIHNDMDSRFLLVSLDNHLRRYTVQHEFHVDTMGMGMINTMRDCDEVSHAETHGIKLHTPRNAVNEPDFISE